MINPTGRFLNPLIALDIGNVSMKLSFDQMYRKFGIDPKDAQAVARLWEHGALLETGRCTVPEFLERLSKIMRRKRTPQQLLDYWRCGVCETMPGMTKAVKDLAAHGVRFSFFSDISPIHLEQVFKYCEFRHLVTGGVYSFEVGAFKMDEGCQMFHAFDAKYGRPALFFDDRIEVVARAVAYGWNAKQFTSPEEMVDAVSEIL